MHFVWKFSWHLNKSAKQIFMVSKFSLLSSSMKLASDYQINELLSKNVLFCCKVGIRINIPEKLFCLKCFHLRESRNWCQFNTKLASGNLFVKHTNINNYAIMQLDEQNKIYRWNFHRLVQYYVEMKWHHVINWNISQVVVDSISRIKEEYRIKECYSHYQCMYFILIEFAFIGKHDVNIINAVIFVHHCFLSKKKAAPSNGYTFTGDALCHHIISRIKI